MASLLEIAEFLGSKGLDLRQEDVDELSAKLAELPPEQHDQIAPMAWEAVAQVVADPSYAGDAKLPEPA